MIGLDLNLEGDNAWPDLPRDDRLIHLKAGLSLAALPGGMSSGLPSVALRIDLPDGKTLVYEISARLFCTAARAIAARYPEVGHG